MVRALSCARFRSSALDHLFILIDGGIDILDQRFADGLGRFTPRSEYAFQHMLQIPQSDIGAVLHFFAGAGSRLC